MKKTAVVLLVLELTLGRASAGVIIEKQTVLDDGTGKPSTDRQTVMVEGNLKKVIGNDGSITIIDLGRGIASGITPGKQVSHECPFSAVAELATTMGSFTAQFQQTLGVSVPGSANTFPGLPESTDVTYRKSGGTKTVAGYRCDEYTASAQSSVFGGASGQTVEDSTNACFSITAPGGAELAAFDRQFAAQLKLKTPETAQPEGLKLSEETTRKVSFGLPPGMPAELRAQMAAQMPPQKPMVSRTQVTSIKTANLPADTFVIPAGYTKEDKSCRAAVDQMKERLREAQPNLNKLQAMRQEKRQEKQENQEKQSASTEDKDCPDEVKGKGHVELSNGQKFDLSECQINGLESSFDPEYWGKNAELSIVGFPGPGTFKTSEEPNRWVRLELKDLGYSGTSSSGECTLAFTKLDANSTEGSMKCQGVEFWTSEDDKRQQLSFTATFSR